MLCSNLLDADSIVEVISYILNEFWALKLVCSGVRSDIKVFPIEITCSGRWTTINHQHMYISKVDQLLADKWIILFANTLLQLIFEMKQ